MTYDTDKLQAGGERIDVVQIVEDACSLTFGTSPCGATGTPCVNSWESCKAPDVYADTTKTFSFCTPVSRVPVGLNLIPFLKRDGVQFDPADLTPEDGIGKVGSATFSFIDSVHDDVGIDPYISQRPTSALTRGTFWPRMRARWPFYQGRTLYWYTGYNHAPFSLANLRKRTYVIESISGFGRAEGVTIKVKDPLKLADNDRTVWPRKTTGTLAEVLTAVASPTTLDVTTENVTEYDLDAWEAKSAVRIKSECFQYTGVSLITGGVRLTGVTRGAPSPYSTTASAHAIGEAVQKCAWFDAMKGSEIIGRMLVTGVGNPAAWVPYATTWDTLYSTWLGSLPLTRLITGPEGITSIITDVMQQSSGWGLWWDDVNEVYQYEVTRPAGLSEPVTVITDFNAIIHSATTVSDDVDRLINNAVFYYGEIDPTKKADDVSNYANWIISRDTDSTSAREVGSLRTRVIYGRWHAASAATTVQRIADRFVVARSSVPFKVEFEVTRKDDSLTTGDFIDLSTVATSAVVDLQGNPRTIRCRVVKADHGKDRVRYTARQDFVSERFGLIAPDALSGLTWADATNEQRATYVFIADNNGLLSDGSPGKRIF